MAIRSRYVHHAVRSLKGIRRCFGVFRIFLNKLVYKKNDEKCSPEQCSIDSIGLVLRRGVCELYRHQVSAAGYRRSDVDSRVIDAA